MVWIKGYWREAGAVMKIIVLCSSWGMDAGIVVTHWGHGVLLNLAVSPSFHGNLISLRSSWLDIVCFLNLRLVYWTVVSSCPFMWQRYYWSQFWIVPSDQVPVSMPGIQKKSSYTSFFALMWAFIWGISCNIIWVIVP